MPDLQGAGRDGMAASQGAEEGKEGGNILPLLGSDSM